MKKIKLLLLLLLPICAYSQKGITFSVETLSKPKNALNVVPLNEVYENLIILDADLKKYDIKKSDIELPFNIIAKSQAPDKLVSFGYHSFFNGMYQAYADHRPFVLSPDMIWLLISQGFARHINADSEQFRDHFVDFDEKISLVVSDNVSLDSSSDEWEKIFPQFTRQIAEHAGNELIELLTADFSTTTPVERVASGITIMEAMKPYFEYVYIYIVCGIPEITLQGTSEDWQKIVDRTAKLAEYKLGWWTDELKPLLEEFVKASKGQIDKEFWQNMFKYHTKEVYGAPKVIDGWIVKFFPYDKHGKRNNLKELTDASTLPEEIVKVDLKYIEKYDGEEVAIPLELWAGFIGLDQDKKSYTLTPQIGWMIRKKDVNDIGLKVSVKSHNDEYGIHIRVKELPEAIFSLEEIKSLTVDFVDKIIIPDRLAKIKIESLTLNGKIDDSEKERIKKMFPNTIININNESLKRFVL